MNEYPVEPAQLNVLWEKVGAVGNGYVELTQRFAGKNFPKSAADPAAEMLRNIELFKEKLERNPSDLDDLVQAAKNVAVYGSLLTMQLSNSASFHEQEKDARGTLKFAADDLREYCDAHAMKAPSFHSTSIPLKDQALKGLTAVVGVAPTWSNEETEKLESFRRQMRELEAKLNGLGSTTDQMVQRVEDVIGDVGRSANSVVEREILGFEKRKTDAVEKINEELIGINNLHDRAKELAGEAANNALAGGYAKSAIDEEKSANFFRNFTLWLMAITAVVLIATLFQLSMASIHWQDVLARVGISLILTLPIGYMAREAGRHRAHSVELRKTALDFAALTPFLATLAPEEQSKLKADIANRFFFSDGKLELPPSYELNLQELLLKVIDTAKK